MYNVILFFLTYTRFANAKMQYLDTVVALAPLSLNFLHLSGIKLTQVEQLRFLGVIIDNELSWEPHLEKLNAKLASCIAVIKRIMKFIPRSEYKKLYDSLFKSHLSYCISSWGGVSPYRLSKLFSIQKRCVRLLFGVKPNSAVI